MRKLGFSEKMVSLIMSCLNSVSYAMLLNGLLVGNIKPSRGLRQGDPLLPYLFLLCAMGLQDLLKKAESNGDIRGVSICRNGPRVSCLFFADDSVLFCQAKEEERLKILDLLSVYERGSGQKINRDKTNIFFNNNTQQHLQTRIQHILGVPAIRQYEKYFGLPALVGRAKKQSFVYIKERVLRKLQGWKEKLLSQAGREIFNKIRYPDHSYICYELFQTSLGLVKELESLTRKFWWGYNGDKRRVHWVSWEKLCEGKENGGMGFKDIEKFNDSLLATQVWCMIHNSDSLCYKVFKARFFPDCSILEAKESTSGLYAWKSILGARDIIRKGMVWRIGNGCSVRIREDRWLPVSSNRTVISPTSTMEPGARVNSLINTEIGEWKLSEVQQLFLPHEADIICGILLSIRLPPDRMIWGLTPLVCSQLRVRIRC